ncbi:uncharacterized protein PAC_14295 [Phialocephala subalpina]|uniref:Uncharacterized protein n=1 Tax=Phialocephala subalpina TaxID=576137 RepID=A0A1L7XHH3_9HELO|nr:uncharacterized protein PAC_14295 [Phialocephala subalpina]
MSVLDAELYRLSTVGYSAGLSQDDLLDESLMQEIDQQTLGHNISIEFLIKLLKTECLKTGLPHDLIHALTVARRFIPGSHPETKDKVYPGRLKVLERRASEAKVFRNSKLKGKLPEKRLDFDGDSMVTFESTERFKIRNEILLDESAEPQFSLEVIEKMFQVTREHVETVDRQSQELNGGFEPESVGRQFQLELRDSRPYRRAGFAFNRETEEFRRELVVPSPSNLTITTEAERVPRSLYMGSDFRYNQGYGRYQSYSVLERISVISEPREVQLHLFIARQDIRAVSDLLERGTDPHVARTTGLATKLWSYPPPIPPLIHAAVLGNTNIIELLIEHGAMIETSIGDRKTALICASIEGHADTVKFLLARGASINRGDEFGLTPLLHASRRGHKVVTDLLIQHGADINVQALHDKRTALYTAASIGYVSIVESLLEHQADINIAAANGFKALHAAANVQQDTIINLLVRSGAGVDSLTENEDGVACEQENLTALESLLEEGADVSISDSEDNTLLNTACPLFLKYGEDVNRGNREGCKPLHHAASKGHTSIISTLLNSGAVASINDATLSGWTPLHYAGKNGHLKAAEILLSRGAQADIQIKPQYETPLWIAISNDNPDMVALLLKNGASQLITCQAEPSNHFPLHAAAMNDCLEICELLFAHGGNANIEDDNRSTPIHYAALGGHMLVLFLLHRHQANIDHADMFGYTTLHVAISADQDDAASWLIGYGADVNYKSLKGITPLHVAALKGDRKTAKVLLNRGADRTALAGGLWGEGDKTAADIARRAGHLDLATFIDMYQNLYISR